MLSQIQFCPLRSHLPQSHNPDNREWYQWHSSLEKYKHLADSEQYDKFL